MQKRGMRYAAGLLVTGLLVGLTAPAARAAGISAPWFGNVSVGTTSSSDPFTLIRSYVPFWSYVEGLPWVAYTEWRVSLTAVPSIYTARSATPLPTLPAQPSFVTAVARVVRAVRPEPAPAPVTAPDTAADFTEPAPDTQTPAPDSQTPAPEAQTPAPDTETPAPDTQTPAPDTQTPAPDTQTPAPEAQTPAPDTQTPAPATQTPAPDTQTPAPATQTPAPDTQTPAPQPDAHAPVPAPTSATASAGLTDDERTLIALVNAERAKAGLTSLQVDMRLVATARAKSQDMVANSYFDHNSPTLGSPFAQMKAAGITYRTAGENIAGNQSVTAAHAAFMNSPGHRANILKPEFTKIGIGIVSGGPYGLMVTQQFIGD